MGMTSDEIINYLENELDATFFADKEAVTTMMNFLAVFSVGCGRLGLKEMANTFSKRLTCFVILVNKNGYKTGRKFKWRTDYGIDTLLSSAFYNIASMSEK
jgi:hypothetical protein